MALGIKGAIGQAVQDLGEAVVKPVAEEVGKAIEEGVQSIVSGPPQPLSQDQDIQQQKQLEEQKKLAWAKRVIEWNRKLQEGQDKVRREKQQELLRKQQEEQEKKRVKQFKVIEQKKKQLPGELFYKGKVEFKRGVGG